MPPLDDGATARASHLPLFASETHSEPEPSANLPSPALRLIGDQADILDERELVTLLLSGARPIDEAETLADTLLSVFRNPSRILAAAPGRLRSIPGIDNDAIVAIKVAESLAIRHSAARLPRTVNPMLNDYKSMIEHCRSLIAHKPHEELHILYLDIRNRPIAFELHRTGTIHNVPAHPRDIVMRTLELNATALVLVHNHPSQVPDPSPHDVALTKEVKTGAACLGIKLLDHIIITESGHLSFAETGLL